MPCLYLNYVIISQNRSIIAFNTSVLMGCNRVEQYVPPRSFARCSVHLLATPCHGTAVVAIWSFSNNVINNQASTQGRISIVSPTFVTDLNTQMVNITRIQPFLFVVMSSDKAESHCSPCLRQPGTYRPPDFCAMPHSCPYKSCGNGFICIFVLLYVFSRKWWSL